jgi:hypothetical protein
MSNSSFREKGSPSVLSPGHVEKRSVEELMSRDSKSPGMQSLIASIRRRGMRNSKPVRIPETEAPTKPGESITGRNGTDTKTCDAQPPVPKPGTKGPGEPNHANGAVHPEMQPRETSEARATAGPDGHKLTIGSVISFFNRNLGKEEFEEMLGIAGREDKSRLSPIPTAGPAKLGALATPKPNSPAAPGPNANGHAPRPETGEFMGLHRKPVPARPKLSPPKREADRYTKPLYYNPDSPPPLEMCLKGRRIIVYDRLAWIKGFNLENECQPQIKVEWAASFRDEQQHFNLVVKAHA